MSELVRSIRPSTWDELLSGPVYIINMDKSVKRLLLAQERIQEAGFKDIRRLSAVDASIHSDLQMHWNKYNSPKFDSKKDPEFIQYPGKQGCFLSHVSLWIEMIDKNIPWVTVFEDDILFHPLWKDYAPSYFKNTPVDWEMIYIGCQMDFESAYHIDQGPAYCTHAMILTQTCAKQLYTTLQSRKEGVYTIDNMFHDMQTAKNFPVPYYIWNARMYPCRNAYMNKGWDRRNHGLVFQDELLGSYIKEHY